MITTQDAITFLNDYDHPTFEFFHEINTVGLERFIKPETNLYSLVLLSQARAQGLDLVFVDEWKFFNNSVLDIVYERLDQRSADEGFWDIKFELSSILHDGYTFAFVDYLESMGYGYRLSAMNFGNEVVNHFISQAGKVNSGIWYDEDVQTIEQLANYINQMITQPEPKDNMVAKYSRKDVVITALTLVVFAMLAGSYFILKAT